MPNYIIKDGVFYTLGEIRGEYVVEWVNNLKFFLVVLATILRAVITVISVIISAYFMWRWSVPGADDLNIALTIASLMLAAIASRP